MKLKSLKGKYVIAVSGGVDSVSLLDLLSKQKDLQLIIGHLDHGIRVDSTKDRQLVQSLAAKYNLPFYFEEANLGPKTSEQKAREVRYKFLNDLVKNRSADGIITAHHQDDQIETAMINIIRGTGRKGLSSLRSDKVIRPLLDYSKSDITKYAKKNNLTWNEDQTNSDLKILRNYIRSKIVPKLDSKTRKNLIDLIKKQAIVNDEIDKQLSEILKDKSLDGSLPRLWVNSLDNSLSREILAAWLRQNDALDYDRQLLNRLAIETKTMEPSKKIEVISGWQIITSRDNLALKRLER